MTGICVRVPTVLRAASGGEPTVLVDATGPVTVAAVLDALAASHPALERRLRDELGRVRVHVNLFVGPDNVRDLQGVDTVCVPGDELTVIAAVSGG